MFPSRIAEPYASGLHDSMVRQHGGQPGAEFAKDVLGNDGAVKVEPWHAKAMPFGEGWYAMGGAFTYSLARHAEQTYEAGRRWWATS